MKLLLVFAAVLLSSVVTAKVPLVTKVPNVTVTTHTHTVDQDSADEVPVVAEVVEVTSQSIHEVDGTTTMPVVEVSDEQMVTKVPHVVNQETTEVPMVVEIVGEIVKSTVTPVMDAVPNVVKVPMTHKMRRSAVTVVDELVKKPVVEMPKVPEVPVVSSVELPIVPVVPSIPVVTEIEEVPFIPAIPAVSKIPVVPTSVPGVPTIPAVSKIPVVPTVPLIPKVPKMRSMAENAPVVPLSMGLDADKTVNVADEKPVDHCDLQCTKFNLNPICSTNGQCNYEFPNQCVMDVFNCKHPELGFKATLDDRCKMHWLKRCTEKDLMG